MGKTTKFMMSWKPVISSIRDAIAMPNAVNEMPIRIMNPRAMRNPAGFETSRPMNTERTRIINPWMTAVVAPPRVWPNMISRRETGATRVSFKKPNCLSHMIWIPEKNRCEQHAHGNHARDKEHDVIPPDPGQLHNRIQAEPQKE